VQGVQFSAIISCCLQTFIAGVLQDGIQFGSRKKDVCKQPLILTETGTSFSYSNTQIMLSLHQQIILHIMDK